MEHQAHTVAATIARAVERIRAAGSESARLDAEVLLASVLAIDRSGIVAYPSVPLSPTQAEAFETYVARRCSGEPVAYIRGIREFSGVALSVDRRVLVPRPETEMLVDLGIERVREALTSRPRPADTAPFLVWDVGTGSGAIAVAIAIELRKRRYGDAVHFHLSDISADALDVAKLNAAAHGVADLMTFRLGDLDDAAPGGSGRADLVVANLPYVPTASMADLPAAISFEPIVALDGGLDGLDVIRRLLPTLPDRLNTAGTALFEIGADQADLFAAAVGDALPGWHSRVHDDLAGLPRVVELQRADG